MTTCDLSGHLKVEKNKQQNSKNTGISTWEMGRDVPTYVCIMTDGKRVDLISPIQGLDVFVLLDVSFV